MSRTINFDDSFGSFEPSGAFVLSDTDLTLVLSGLPESVSGDDVYYLIIKNDVGKSYTHRLTAERKCEIGRTFLLPGRLTGRVERRLNSVTAQSWEIEPLAIVRLDTDIHASPVIAEAERKIAALADELAAYKTEITAKIETLCTSFSERIEKAVGDLTTSSDAVTDGLDEKIKAVAGVVSEYLRSAAEPKKKRR